MRAFCPESELIAAAVEGGLTADEQWRLENHAAACDDCRREWAIAGIRRVEPSAEIPAALKVRVKSAVARLLDRERGTRRKTRTFRPASTAPLWGVAASILIFAGAALLLAVQLRRRADRPVVVVPESPTPRTEKTEPSRKEESARRLPRPPRLPALGPVERAPERKTELVEKPEEKPERPAEKPVERSKETVARVFEPLRITDLSGELTVRRNGAKEKARGVVVLSAGDEIAAAGPASFYIEGRHAVVLPAASRLSLATSATEQATWLSVREGTALVDPDGGSRWAVSDGRSVAILEKGRARFAASREPDGLTLTALSDSLRVAPEGGTSETVRSGDEWRAGTIGPSSKAALFKERLGAGRPRERSVFFATCDPDDLRCGRWAIAEGILEKKTGFLASTDKRLHHLVEIRLDQRIAWDFDHVVRFRYRTNAKRLLVHLPLPEGKGLLLSEITVGRDAAGRWTVAELPLSGFQVVGADRVVLSSYDRMESIEFRAAQGEIWSGSGRGTVAIDDVQILELRTP